MRRSVLASACSLLAGALTVAVLATAPPAAADPPGTPGTPGERAEAKAADTYGNTWNILPPGQKGVVTATDLASLLGTTATPTNPPNYADQLEMYDALTKIDPKALTQADIDRLYKQSNFTPQTVVSTLSPAPGVTIQRDQYDVPYITGATYDDVEFGAGYAATQDRMFLMDVLRHTGEARMAEFVGNTPANVAMDREQLETAYYTPAEANAQIQAAANRAGVDGTKLVGAVDAFIAGINKAQFDMCPTIVALTCPVEYAALQKAPTPWTRADVVYIASLVGGIFGKGGGHEIQNAAWYQALRAKFGKAEAKRIYDDLREKNDPEAPTTSPKTDNYEGGGVNPDLPGVALPDRHAATAPGTGAALRTSPAPRAAATPQADLPAGVHFDLPLRQQHGMSNAVLVTRQNSTTGHPLAVMGPQTSYYTPQLLTEEVLNGPGILARGVAFAGTNLFVQLGRGLDYSWSATSAGSDNIDVVAEKLCNADGSRATVSSTSYLVGKKCVPIDQQTFSETTTPNLAAPAPATTYNFLVMRTRHGIVQERTTVKGVPVALVVQRSTYGHEVDSVIGFGQFNDPNYVHNAASFQKAASHIDYTFNWFYADDKDISYFSSGLLPNRSKKVEPDFPHWAGKKYDWRGWLPAKKHAHVTDPKTGYLVSWNNKQAPGFGAADDNWSYGPVYRSLALQTRVEAAIKGHRKTDLPGLVGVMSGAATADSRAVYTLKWLLKVIGKDPKTKVARALLTQWLHAGAPRVDRDRSGSYDYQAAIDLFDTWWQSGSNSVAYDVMSGKLGTSLVHQLPQAIDDHPRIGRGSAFNGVAWYGYVNKVLRMALGKKVQGAYSTDYCGKGTLASCRKVLRHSLAAAVARAEAAQGVHDPRQLTYDKTLDDIRSVTAGLVGVRPIDWQNRPTFQQVVEYVGHH